MPPSPQPLTRSSQTIPAGQFAFSVQAVFVPSQYFPALSDGSNKQREEHPSLFSAFPSSQSSPGSGSPPFPQTEMPAPTDEPILRQEAEHHVGRRFVGNVRISPSAAPRLA